MRKNYNLLLFVLALAGPYLSQAQCSSTVALGSASNLFTKVINSTSSIAADKNLNTVVFIHRNNATLNGGNSGQLRYDYSTNGGVTWTVDQGVLNPVNTSLARYPNVAIYNPTLNTTPSNAYVSYMGATINNASAWNGNVTGVRQLNNTGNTEFYNQPNGPLAYIPRSLTKGAPGVFWAIDAQWGSNLSGFNIYKGTWSTTVNDIVWATNFTVTPPFNLAYSNFVYVGIDYNIAFDPTGNIGWFSFIGHVTPGPANYAYYPVFYKTTDGGNTWTGPITADLNQMGCLTGNVGNGMPSTNLEHDLVVDMYGNPHFITTILPGNNNYSFNYSGWHHITDITMVNGIWTAYDIANVNGAPYTFGVSPNFVTQYQAPQAARTADGSKVFFTWVDNSSYSAGAQNSAPNLFGRGFDVVNKTWTNVKDFTSCNAPIAGSVFFPHIASEVLEPSNTTFKLATCYGVTTNNDPGLVANFRFLDNVTFTTTEFATPQPSLNVTITQGSLALACGSGSINLTLSGSYDAVQWSNGPTTAVNPVSLPGIYTVTAASGCAVGTKTINVALLTTAIQLPVQPAVCEGLPLTMTVVTNAPSYTWQPSGTTNNTLTVMPQLNDTYSVEVSGSGCTTLVPVNVTIAAAPVLTVTGSNTVCIGSSVSQTVSGAQNYNWPGIGGGNVISMTPTANSVYTVVGTDINFCIGSKTVAISVVNIPTLTAGATKTVICPGQTTTLTANGAISYSVSSPSSTSAAPVAFVPVSPTVTTTYTFTGVNTAGCSGRAAVTISVAACTGVSSIEANSNTHLLVYPNPTNGRFMISTDSDLDIVIVNELGQEVRHVELDAQNNHMAEVNDLPNGIYVLRGQTAGQLLQQKIIIRND